MTNSFCSLPWVGLDISPVGTFKPCCKYKNTIANSIDSYLQSSELLLLKEEFLAGKRPAGCARCWADEDAGLLSKRQLDFKYTFNNVDSSLDTFKVISFPFGNTCNLACRICNSSSSSKWRDTEMRMNIAPVTIHKHQKYYKDTEFVNRIIDLAKDCIHFDFYGGEPFITGVNEQINFLDAIVANNNAKNISLHYTTNCTTWPDDRFWSRWQHFKNVEVQLSIDDTTSAFEYQRWPASWQECYNIIKKFQRVDLQNFKLSISHSLSIFNVMHLNNFIEWTRAESLPYPYIGLVSRPKEFDISNLPANVKQKITNCVTPEVLHYMNIKESVDFRRALDRIAEVDLIRKQSFDTSCHDLFSLLDFEYQKYYKHIIDSYIV